MISIVALAAAMAAPVCAADVCNPAKLEGAYGFQLSGPHHDFRRIETRVSVGRLVFDGHGVVSGYSSVNFAGYFLGNPVTGDYETHDDCTLTWSLQDDSGAFQHFSGKLTARRFGGGVSSDRPGRRAKRRSAKGRGTVLGGGVWRRFTASAFRAVPRQ